MHYIIQTTIQNVAVISGSDASAIGKTIRRNQKINNCKSERKKFSILDSIKSMILVTNFGQKVKDKIKEYSIEKWKKGLYFHPLIVVVNDKNGKPNKYLVCFNSTTLAAPNFLEALKTLMHIFYVFNFRYASESAHIGHFLEHFFFGVKLQKIPGYTAIKNLLNLL